MKRVVLSIFKAKGDIMLILIKIQNSPEQRFLVKLHEPELVDEIQGLIRGNKYSKAVVTALSKGKFLREVSQDEVHGVEANMILTEKNVQHDLM